MQRMLLIYKVIRKINDLVHIDDIKILLTRKEIETLYKLLESTANI